ncbi:MAG: methylenetetrahydrofolate reductase [Oscillospiraceae bacterium]|nr:methylenetetrahydrofolate reductase [Oscillospiraceae bacterium]
MRISELFARGEFVLTAEVGPPKGFHLDHLLHEAEEFLQDVHAINVTDCQSSVMRLSSLATCKALKDKGLNSIFQLTCRDRNRIALQSDLLSAAFFGIDNMLALTGDHTVMGDTKQAKPVFDLDSVSLLHCVKTLESGVDLAGNELDGEPPKFAKGAVVSPCSDSVDVQLAKMERKVEAGAEYFQTQAVYDSEKFIRFMEKAKQFKVPVQLGVIIPKNAGMANFMNNNIAGVSIPPEIIEELKADKEKTKAGVTGVEITARIIKECKDHCQGVHIMALGWESKVPALLEQAGLKGS